MSKNRKGDNKTPIATTIKVRGVYTELDETIEKLNVAIEKANRLERVLAEIQSKNSSLSGE